MAGGVMPLEGEGEEGLASPSLVVTFVEGDRVVARHMSDLDHVTQKTMMWIDDCMVWCAQQPYVDHLMIRIVPLGDVDADDLLFGCVNTGPMRIVVYTMWIKRVDAMSMSRIGYDYGWKVVTN